MSVPEPSPSSRSQPMKRAWVLGAVAVAGLVAARAVASLDSSALASWEYSDARLPFALRFAFTPAVTWVLGMVVLAAAALAVGVRRAAPRLSVAAGVVMVAGAAGGAAVTLLGLWLATHAPAFPLAEGQSRCPCGGELVAPLECHCGADGVVVERFFRAADDSAAAARLDGAPLVVRETWTKEGLRASAPRGGPSVLCRFVDSTAGCPVGVPCRCAYDADDFSVGPDVVCFDQREGRGALSGFVQLHRTVWAWPTTGGPVPRALDDALALPTERSELIGAEAELRRGDADVAAVVFGARPMQRRGVRVCVLPSGRSSLTQALDAPVTTPAAIVRLEAAD